MRNIDHGFSWIFHCPILGFSFYRVATLLCSVKAVHISDFISTPHQQKYFDPPINSIQTGNIIHVAADIVFTGCSFMFTEKAYSFYGPMNYECNTEGITSLALTLRGAMGLTKDRVQWMSIFCTHCCQMAGVRS